MSKEERLKLFKKHGINESHSVWEPSIDNWYSVEAARQQLGRLPEEKDDTVQVLSDFLDNEDLQRKLLREKGAEFGSMYLSAKRALYRYTQDRA